jgi:hypothetical protein
VGDLFLNRGGRDGRGENCRDAAREAARFLCLCAFVPLCLCAFVPLCLCAFVPLCLCARSPQRTKAWRGRAQKGRRQTVEATLLRTCWRLENATGISSTSRAPSGNTESVSSSSPGLHRERGATLGLRANATTLKGLNQFRRSNVRGGWRDQFNPVRVDRSGWGPRVVPLRVTTLGWKIERRWRS